MQGFYKVILSGWPTAMDYGASPAKDLFRTIETLR